MEYPDLVEEEELQVHKMHRMKNATTKTLNEIIDGEAKREQEVVSQVRA